MLTRFLSVSVCNGGGKKDTSVALVVAPGCAPVSFRFVLCQRASREKSNGHTGNTLWFKMTSAGG